MEEPRSPTATGLDYFRRRRPFVVPEDPTFAGRYNVIDPDTAERLGVLETLGANVVIARSFDPSPANSAEPDQTSDGERAASIPLAADKLWARAYPWKSRFWRAMRVIVLSYDWLMRLIVVVVRIALVVAAALFVYGWIDFAWEARDLLEDIALRWLRNVRGQP